MRDKDDNILAKHQVGDLLEIASLEVGVSEFAFYFKINKVEWEQHFGSFVVEQETAVKQCRGAHEMKTGKNQIEVWGWENNMG